MIAPTRRPQAAPTNLVELLRQQAARHADKVAFRVLLDEGGADELTYSDLFDRATRVASRLQQTAKPGDRALLLTTTSVDTIVGLFGCICAGVLAVPVPLPRAFHPCARLQSVLADAEPALVLSSAATRATAGQRFAKNPGLLALPWLAVDEALSAVDRDWKDPQISPDSVAFLQYTSGSTASPKGVMVSHGNVMANTALIQERLQSSEQTRMVSWLPLFHDMGLIGVIMHPLRVGGSATLLSPASFMLRPFRWLAEVSAQHGDISGGPDFAYELCVRKTTPAERASLDLSCWRAAFSGAEPVRAETIERFSEAFAPSGFRREAFYPCYGLAEATLMVAGNNAGTTADIVRFDATSLEVGKAERVPANAAGSAPFVSNGRTSPGHRVAIVNPVNFTECAPGEVGEIWFSGPSVAGGYWNKTELSQATFHAKIAGSNDEPFLRTGDLGFVDAGRLFIAGRLKDLIIIRGRNYYPSDIETTVVHVHPGFRPGGTAAFSVCDGEREKLVVVQEVDRSFPKRDADDAIVLIRKAVALEHEVEVSAIVLLKPTTLPRTTSGKVQRSRCREAFLTSELEVLSRWDLVEEEAIPTDELGRPAGAEWPSAAAIEEFLVAGVADKLGVPEKDIQVDQQFAALGLASKDLVALVGRLQNWLGRPLSPALVFNYSTIERLAAHLAETPALAADVSSADAAEDPEADEISAMSESELDAYVEREISKLR